ncbi:GNAT family N-acetyltransferase [Prevotella dentasini]|uniref:GNAT family N-acetyltransferase n=1 Tax=Prevotella dentasini TaxID=589537 RepID=UPI00046850E4|nr:GNAT family N-acetyltransferase [Prevotella dentasini]
MFEVRRYTAEQQDGWNRFVGLSKQGTFLVDRSYMDYHADRFADHSLVVFRNGRIYALLPACQSGSILYSHQGLTYGGLITGTKATAAGVCTVFEAINGYLAGQGISRVVYKAIPWIYHQLPAEEDLYALTSICNARLTVRHISSVIPFSCRMKFTESRRSGIRKALRAGIAVSESTDLAAFWAILNGNLEQKYGTHPVHTLSELQLLKARFPQAIRLFLASNSDGLPIGGTLVYETPRVVHTQYISASPEGKATGALDFLFDYIINKVYADRKGFFDFGKSSDGDGRQLNSALIFQKEGFGGRGVCYDWYEWETGSGSCPATAGKAV